jgi:hypothetical protein
MALREALAEFEGDYLESALGATRRAADLWPEDDEWQALEAQIRERRQGEGERLFAQAREALQKLEGSLETAEEVDLESRLGNVFQDLDCLDRLKVEVSLTEDLRREASALRTELERRRARRVHRQNLVESTTIKYLNAGRERLERSQSLESDGERSWESAIEVYREARQAFRTVLQASDNHAEALRSIEVIESALARLGKQVDEHNRRVLEISERVEHGNAQMEEARRLSIDGSSIPALARRLLDDAALSMSRVLELDPDCIDAVVLRDRIEGLQTRLKRRADRQERIRSAVREGLCVGRSELAVAKRLVVPEDEETLRRGQTAANEAQTALKRVLVVNGTHPEALAMSGEVDSLLEHYRSELMRLREFSRCEHKADGLRVNSRRRIDEWLRTAERTLVDASGMVGESPEDLRVSRAYCAEVDVALQHILWLEPDHLEARRLDEKRQFLLRDLEAALEAADGTRESSVGPVPFVPPASEEGSLRSSSVDKTMRLVRIVFWGTATVTLGALLWVLLQGL